jgi:hypothetical protein
MNRILNIFALIAIGLSIGWMMGMSVSPVVQTILTSVIAVVVSMLSLLMGVPPKTKTPVALWPIALFMVTMVLGSAGGVFTRTNDLLGPRPGVVAWRWGGNNVDSLIIARSLMASFITSTTQTSTNTNQRTAVLFGVIKPTPDFCERTRYANGGVLKTLIERLVVDRRASIHSPDEKRALDSLQRLLDAGLTDSTLKQIRTDLCKSNTTGS